MKRIKAMVMLLFVLGTVSFHACKQTLPMDDIFEVSASSVSLNYQGLSESGDNAEIEVGTSGSWRVTSKPDWVELSRSSGERGRHSIFLIVDEAGTAEDRAGNIVIESLGQSITVTVQQGRKMEELSVSPSELTVDIRGLLDDGRAPSIYVSTNSDWQISDLPEWITVDHAEGRPGNMSVVLTVAKNSSGDVRQGSFTVTSGGLTEEVQVEQSLSYAPLTDMTEIIADQYGDIISGSAVFEVNSVESWTITSDSWIHVTPNSGEAGITEVTVSIDPAAAARVGAITITDADDLTTVITVEQEILMPDDGQAIGFVYLDDDFEWVREYNNNAVDEIANNGTGSTFPINGNQADRVLARNAFNNRGYEDINPGSDCFYLGAHYFKMGKTNHQTGVRLNGIPNIDSDKTTNATLTFNATPVRHGSGNYDNVQLIVLIEGPGTVGSGSSKVSEEIDIPIENGVPWHWLERSVVLYGISADTKVTIKTTKNGTESGVFRWSLNDIKIEKHSVVD